MATMEANELDRLGEARLLQLTDTHLSAGNGVPPALDRLLAMAAADPPDLVLLTGDLVLEDPDDEEDRRFARAVFDSLPCPWLAIPGNHDVGFYGEDAERPARVAAFVATWGGDRFAVDVAGWRVVGVNAYALGDAEHDRWLTDVVVVERPVAVFVHQPVDGEPVDGWEMPSPARRAFADAVSGADVRLVASGHRHCYVDRGRDVWAPSTTFVGEVAGQADPGVGAVEHRLRRDGTHDHRLIHPP